MECLLVVPLVLWSMLLITVSANDSPTKPSVSAMFVFGDWLVESGNNNKLQSIVKANYMPYGIDFPGGYPSPTGRFSNGKMVADFLGEMMGLPVLPTFADTVEQNIDISRGVNFASASSGILDETGRNLGEHISFRRQVTNFETILSQMKTQMDDENLSQYLANSFATVIQGSSDYINNYLTPEFYVTSFVFGPNIFAEILIKDYKKHILELHSLGLRKFYLAAVEPLISCMPFHLFEGMVRSEQYRTYVNDLIMLFNSLLRSLVDELNTEYTDSTFLYGDTYIFFYINDRFKNTWAHCEQSFGPVNVLQMEQKHLPST